ncbi:MAG: hypothetical protein HOY76_20355, partial [Streptomyces sp.]|nr:hypothetical protein [Streptomyces sp.]
QAGDLDAENNILGSLGLILRREGRLTEARARFEEGAAICARIGSHAGACILGSYLVRVLVELGEADAAAEAAEQAVRRGVEAQHARALKEAYAASGYAAYSRGDYELAAAHLTEAVELARSSGLLGLAGNLFLLAKTRLAQGEEKDAVAFAEESRQVYRELGRPDADVVQDWLTSWRTTAER